MEVAIIVRGLLTVRQDDPRTVPPEGEREHWSKAPGEAPSCRRVHEQACCGCAIELTPLRLMAHTWTKEIPPVMDMTYGLHARQRHYERIAHALGPRPEPYGQVVQTATKRSLTVWPRIAHVMRGAVLFIPRVTSSRRA